MDIQATKLELMQLLLQTEEEEVLIRLRTVFQEQTTDWWERLSSEEKEKIETGIREADRGELIANSEVRKRFKRWH